VVHDYELGDDRSNPSRYQEAITEFPMFSFLLGDMHPHVLALPYALMSMALAFNLYRMSEWRATDEAGTRSTSWRGWFWDAAPIGLMYPIFLGALSFLNTWDFPIHVVIAVAAWGLGRWLFRPHVWPNVRTIVGDAFYALLMCGVLGVIAYVPFYIGFRSQLGGIVPNIYNATRWQQFVVMFGPFLLIGIAFVVVLIGRAVRARRLNPLLAVGGTLGGGALLVVGAGVVTGAVSLLMLLLPGVQAKLDQISRDFASRGISLNQVLIERLGEVSVPILLGVFIAGIVIILIARARSITATPELVESNSASQTSEDVSMKTVTRPPGLAVEQAGREGSVSFALMLLLAGAVSAFIVEYVYLLDQFGYRINTIFKLYYQTWALWGVAAAYVAFYLLRSTERLRNGLGRIGFGALLAIVFVGGMMYPVIAMRDKVDPNRVLGEIPPTLNVRDVTTRFFAPDEVAVIGWLEQNVSDRPVILETEGIPYQAGTSRLSAWTGLPTVLGWVGHEHQWRGVYDDIAPRQQDIDKLYTTTDLTLAQELLDKYDVEFVYVGPNERNKYPQDGLEKFGRLMAMVIQQGGSTLYQRMSTSPSETVSTN
jgi:YYY domain-containing protein